MKKYRTPLICVLVIVLSSIAYMLTYNINLSNTSSSDIINREAGKDVEILVEKDFDEYKIIFYRTTSDLDWGILALKEGFNNKHRIDFLFYSDSKHTVKKHILNHNIKNLSLIASENKDNVVKEADFFYNDGTVVKKDIKDGPFLMVLSQEEHMSLNDIIFYDENNEDIRDYDEKNGAYGYGSKTYYLHNDAYRSFDLVLMLISFISIVGLVVSIIKIKQSESNNAL